MNCLVHDRDQFSSVKETQYGWGRNLALSYSDEIAREDRITIHDWRFAAVDRPQKQTGWHVRIVFFGLDQRSQPRGRIHQTGYA
jgi:hypothetical protein